MTASALVNRGTGLRRPRLTAFLCALAVAALFIVPFIVRGGGVLYITDDQITQLLPFSQAMVANVHSGQWLYDFNLDLGSGLIEGYTYYGLASPFSLLLYCFPTAAAPYLFGPLLMVKFACAGLFSFIWLRRGCGSDLAALIGSLLYAFCGLAIANMIFPFADTYALFPLLPLGVDMALQQNGPGEWRGRALLALAVAVNLLTSPPLAFGSAVFMGLYLLVGLLWKRWRFALRPWLGLCVALVVGVALAGAALLPFVASLAANPRVGGTLPVGGQWLVYVAYRYFELVRALVLPAEVMHLNATMVPVDLVSPELYLPLFGLVPVFAYVLSRRREWLTGLLGLSLVCLLLPVLNSAFNAFNATYYTRWLYAPALMAALATARTVEQPNEAIPLRRGYVAWGVLAALYAACLALWVFYYKYETAVNHWPLFIVNLAICAGGLAATGASRRLWRAAPRLLAGLVGLFAVACGIVNLAANQSVATQAFGKLADIPKTTTEAAAAVPLPEGVYRINAPVANLYFDHGSPFSFTSTVPAGVFELQAAFGRQRTSISRIEYDEVGLWSLLGVKYLLLGPGQELDMLPSLEHYADSTPYMLAENLDALPLVIGFDAWVPADEAVQLENREKSILLLHALALDDAAAAALPGLRQLDADDGANRDYATGVAARQAQAASQVSLSAARMDAAITMPAAGALLITLPYDSGWGLTIDGQPAELVKADWGMMAAACPAGAHQLTLRYWPTGQTAGLVLTVAGLLGLAALLWLGRRRRRRSSKISGG